MFVKNILNFSKSCLSTKKKDLKCTRYYQYSIFCVLTLTTRTTYLPNTTDTYNYYFLSGYTAQHVYKTY